MVGRVAIMGLCHTAIFSPEPIVWDPGKVLLAVDRGVLCVSLNKLVERSGSRRCYSQSILKSFNYEGLIGIYDNIKILTLAYPSSSGEKILILGRRIHNLGVSAEPPWVLSHTRKLFFDIFFSMVWQKVLLAGIRRVLDLLVNKLVERYGNSRCYFQSTF